jgi:hypothetical protein
MFMAVLDRDVPAERCLDLEQFPDLYRYGLTNRLFNTKIFWKYVVNALYHSCLALYVTAFSFMSATDADGGQAFGLSSLGVSPALVDTQGLIEIYYDAYNPDVYDTQKMLPVDQLRVTDTIGNPL